MKHFVILFTFLCTAILSAQNWEPSYEDALVLAKETGKPLVLVFAGSDWCAPCIKLEKEIWQSTEFIAYASENYILYRADFPRKKKNRLSEKQTRANGELADKFNSEGHFPLVLVVDAQETVLGATSYKKIPPKEYITHLNSLLP